MRVRLRVRRSRAQFESESKDRFCSVLTGDEIARKANRVRTMPAAQLRAWGYFWFMIVVVSWQAFSVVPLGNAISLSHFSKHALAMSLLCALLHYALLVSGNLTEHAMRIRIFIAILAYGIFVELVHAFLPWRSAEVIDIVADLTGILLYLVLAAIAQRMGLWPDFKQV